MVTPTDWGCLPELASCGRNRPRPGERLAVVVAHWQEWEQLIEVRELAPVPPERDQLSAASEGTDRRRSLSAAVQVCHMLVTIAWGETRLLYRPRLPPGTPDHEPKYSERVIRSAPDRSRSRGREFQAEAGPGAAVGRAVGEPAAHRLGPLLG